MKILVVEDDKISSLYLSKIASPYGDCEIAEDGEIASKKIKNSFTEASRYDVVFLDIMLPKLSGQVLLQLIRAYEADFGVPDDDRSFVIMTTALKDSDNVSTAYANLVDSYLVKPILKEKVDELLKKIIQHKS